MSPKSHDHAKTRHRDSGLREVLEDKPEDERKYKIGGESSYETRVNKLTRIFNFVVQERDHFQFLGHNVHTGRLDPEIVQFAKMPNIVTYIQETYYWVTADLDGYLPGHTRKAELRTRRKQGKNAFQQVLKLSRKPLSGSSTLSRGEHKRMISGFGIKLDIYDEKEQQAVDEIIGKKPVKPLVHLQVQSEKMLYHPDGRRDVLFELKFDSGKGWTFDGFSANIIEIEIEVKEHGHRVSKKQIEKLLNKAERILMSQFADDMEPIFEPKAMVLFRHLAGWMQRDPKNFRNAWDAVKRTPWLPALPKSSRAHTPSV